MKIVKRTKLETATVVLAFLPLLITLILFPSLPNSIPAHYGISGEVNRWGSKYESLILPAFTALWAFFPFFIGKFSAGINASGNTANQKVTDMLFLSPVLIFNILSYISLFTDFTKATDLSSVGFNRCLVIVLALGDIVFGNYLPKWRQNSGSGFLVKTTLKSEETWNKTNRFAGRLIVLTGAAVIAVCAFLPESIMLILVYAAATVLDLIAIAVCSQRAAHGAEKEGKK
jgi:uncharacterized membrane protein